MSDFKFNCSSCGQRLSGDERYAGLQITCPSCGQSVVVPTTTAKAVGARTVPPVPGAGPRQTPSPARKTSGLAIASLVCSIGSFIIIPLGFIPGIICGHMARKRIAARPSLQGSGLAKAGLIIGYIALGVNLLVVLALAAFFVFFATRMRQMIPAAGHQHSVMSTQPRGAAPAEGRTTDTGPDGSGWTKELAGVEIPSGPVTGRIQGQPFKMENVTLENGWLKFAQGKDFFANLEMDVVLFEDDSTKLSGRTFIVPKDGFGLNPHIWMKWKEEGGNLPKQRNFMDGYALRLEFGRLSRGKLPGKIYLCVPDKEKSFVAGTFEVQVRPKRSRPKSPKAGSPPQASTRT